MLNLNIMLLNMFLSSMSLVRWANFDEDSKQRILTAAITEIPLLRYATRYFSTNCNVTHRCESAKAIMQQMFVPKDMAERVVSLMVKFAELGLDRFETSLLVTTCILSPDRGLTNKTDYQVLSIAQEMVFQIFRLKLELSNRPPSLLIDSMAFVTQLRNFALVAQPEWQKYMYHVTKVFVKGQSPREKTREGTNYLAQFQQNHL